MLNSVGLQGPGVAAWLADELPALAAAGRHASWRQHLGPAGRATTSAAADAAGRRAAGRRRRRGQRLAARTSRTAASMFAHSADGHRRGDARPRPAAAGPAGPSSAPTSPTSPTIAAAAARRPAPRRSRWSTRCWAWPSTSRPAGPCSANGGRRAVGSGHPPGRGAGRPRRRTPPSPTCPIVGVGGVSTRRRRGRAAAGRRLRGPGRHGHLRRPPRPAPGRSTSCERWCRRPRRRVASAT